MPTVYVVQELTRYHCPKCDGTYSKRISRPRETTEYQCQNDRCRARFSEGVLKPTHSLTQAAVFGPMEVLIRSHRMPVMMQQVYEDMKDKLKDFKDGDYILPVGDPVAIAMATTIAARKAETGRVNFLRWDRQTRQYIEVRVNLND